MKLLDAVFAMSVAPYARHKGVQAVSPKLKRAVYAVARGSPFVEHELKVGPKAVQKLVHVAIQRMLHGNAESQEYFGRRHLHPWTGDQQPFKPAGPSEASSSAASGSAASPGSRAKALAFVASSSSLWPRPPSASLVPPALSTPSPPSQADAARTSWMDALLGQIEDPLGAAVTLARLLGNNEYLMGKYATPSLVQRFLAMISHLGPQPRLVNFFEAVCTVNVQPVKANQEMILRLTWIDEVARRKVYLETRAAMGPEVTSKLPAYGPVMSPSGEMANGRVDVEQARKNSPAAYIGKLSRCTLFAANFLFSTARHKQCLSDTQSNLNRLCIAPTFFFWSMYFQPRRFTNQTKVSLQCSSAGLDVTTGRKAILTNSFGRRGCWALGSRSTTSLHARVTPT